MEIGTPTRKSLVLESFGLAITYLFLTALFFWLCVYFSESETIRIGQKGIVSHSGSVDAVSGFLSFSTMSAAVWNLRRNKMVYNVIVCFLISAFVATVDYFTTMEIYRLFFTENSYEFSFAANLGELFTCWAVFFGWSCVFLTLLYNFDIRDRERRLAAVREEALSAQMRALRYQVNPHFLFNTLNSIAGLIEEGCATRAERMVLSLSTFLRTTLTLEPFHDVRLSEELTIQEEYLAIEHERFSDRMTFHIDMPNDVRHALVPSLILQPLIENAIKHGVGSMAGRVNISLSARREADRLRVIVENDMPTETVSPNRAGAGVGLKNVAERLRAQFQDDGRFSAGPAAPGVFRAALEMPWRT
ncbi:histidine kinase [Methylosinus sp. sav-2]|nr:histidine kinase [Methylosinus sp. sav-2]